MNESVPRGRILDRNGKVLVDNASKMAITYTRGRKTTQSEMLDTAEKLSKLIKMDTKKITERDKKISGFSCILKSKSNDDKRTSYVSRWKY